MTDTEKMSTEKLAIEMRALGMAHAADALETIWSDFGTLVEAYDKLHDEHEAQAQRISELEWALKQAIQGEEVAVEEAARLRGEVSEPQRSRYKAALERIAGQDYRGNMPREISIARAALNEEGGDA